jgi:hypothetical protein
MFVLGKVSPFGDKKKDATNSTKEFWGMFLHNLPYLEGKLLKIITFKLSIHGGCQYKVGL